MLWESLLASSINETSQCRRGIRKYCQAGFVFLSPSRVYLWRGLLKLKAATPVIREDWADIARINSGLYTAVQVTGICHIVEFERLVMLPMYKVRRPLLFLVTGWG